MKFSSLTKKSMIGDGLHVINIRRTFLTFSMAATLLAVSAFGAGIWLGRITSNNASEVRILQDPVKEKFAIDKLGELSGRLLRLESDAAYLVKTVSNHEKLTRELSHVSPDFSPDFKLGPAPKLNSRNVPSLAPKSSDGKGGIWLPPRGCDLASLKQLHPESLSLSHLDQIEASTQCLGQIFDTMKETVTLRNADFMAIPSLQPVEKARIGSPFGNRTDPFNGSLAFHSGLDFAAPTGTPIYAAAGGRVKYAGPQSNYGNTVEIDHGNGLVTRYAHASQIHVAVGDVVMPHALIASMGSTGRSTGSHLHFEVMYNGQFMDPQNFLSLNNMDFASDDLAAD